MNKTFQSVKNRVVDLGRRAAGQNLNIGVTGLSQSGKSTFITSLVHQLLNANRYNNLPFFKLAEQASIVSVKICESDDLTAKQFDYEQNYRRIKQGKWPKSTVDITQLKLKIKYRTSHSVLKNIAEHSVIELSITDYPGEWLVDITMLQQNYNQWSDYALSLLALLPQAKLQWQSSVDKWLTGECSFSELIVDYKQCIKLLTDQKLLASPGRFTLPGDLADTPILDFVPLDSEQQSRAAERHLESLEKIIQRYHDFKIQVVEPFFAAYFKTIDRQLILVDCIELLRQPHTYLKVLQDSYNQIVSSLAYGNSNVLTRLFAPKIDKLMMVATKSDQLPTDQQSRLLHFARSLFYPLENKVAFEESKVSYLPVASVRATESVVADIEGKHTHCIRGVLQDSEGSCVLFPGIFPETVEQLEQTQQVDDSEQFDLPLYRVPSFQDDQLPHIRLGKILEFLIGDKVL
ncbi:MAG: YcjX family protein [Kangiellaceae bacterium]|jgi:predicted YcjX-like family ATPase|nr:YcjX family protein [Kangiellaceae bacterium]